MSNDRFKFRAWDGERLINNIGVHPHISQIHEEHKLGDIGYLTVSPLMTSYKIMQCTGLKDKNGKLIFEGDVLFWDGSILGAVSFQNCEYIVGTGVNSRALCTGMDVEVIGNIYENPELLES